MRSYQRPVGETRQIELVLFFTVSGTSCIWLYTFTHSHEIRGFKPSLNYMKNLGNVHGSEIIFRNHEQLENVEIYRVRKNGTAQTFEWKF